MQTVNRKKYLGFFIQYRGLKDKFCSISVSLFLDKNHSTSLIHSATSPAACFGLLTCPRAHPGIKMMCCNLYQSMKTRTLKFDKRWKNTLADRALNFASVIL